MFSTKLFDARGPRKSINEDPVITHDQVMQGHLRVTDRDTCSVMMSPSTLSTSMISKNHVVDNSVTGQKDMNTYEHILLGKKVSSR
jgi:hypothetical protein